MRHKIVILEGPDASGKTTFAKFLHKEFGFEYHHEGVPPVKANLFEYYGKQLLNAKLDGGNHVFDRQFLGQLVYGPIHRNDAVISAIPFMRLVYGWDIKMFIFNNKDFDGQYFIWEKRNGIEHIKDKTVLLKCWHSWKAIEADFPFIPTFDWTKQSYDELLDIIGVEFYRLPAHLIGSPMAKYLFVGERANSEVLNLPFFTSQASSGYLQKAIEAAGFKEHEVAFANAFDLDNKEIKWWSYIGDHLPNLETIICLGNKAYDSVPTDLTVQVIKAPHPAYWSRFKSHQQKDYVNLIRPRYI